MRERNSFVWVRRERKAAGGANERSRVKFVLQFCERERERERERDERVGREKEKEKGRERASY